MISSLLTGAVLGLAAAAGVSDLRTRRIPNTLVVGAFALALCLRAGLGWDATVAGLGGALIALAVGLPFFLIGAVGGGDVKLLVAFGALLGPPALMTSLLLIALFGGALSVAVLLHATTAVGVLQRTASLLAFALTLGRHGAATTIRSPGAITVPYGLAIGAGAALGVLL